MNATERARRSDALYYDNISRRELCDMIAHLESDLAESKAENTSWHEVGTMGEMQDGKGNSLSYGAFGSGTYGLTTTVDGREVELCVRAEIGENVYGKADELLAKLAGGWRPRNW